jgi:hypothetical protein
MTDEGISTAECAFPSNVSGIILLSRNPYFYVAVVHQLPLQSFLSNQNSQARSQQLSILPVRLFKIYQ